MSQRWKPAIVLKDGARDRTVLSLFLAYISKRHAAVPHGCAAPARGPVLSPFSCKIFEKESRIARCCA